MLPRRNERLDLDPSKTRRGPGRFWAHEVIAKNDRGEPVSLAALEMAREALKHETGREPGADDE